MVDELVIFHVWPRLYPPKSLLPPFPLLPKLVAVITKASSRFMIMLFMYILFYTASCIEFTFGSTMKIRLPIKFMTNIKKLS